MSIEKIGIIKKRALFIHIALIIILGFAIYGNSLNGRFIRDDHELIENNAYLKSWSNIPKIFVENIGTGAGIKSRSYRPIQMLTYMIDHSLYRLNVIGYHLTNILLHILVALSIYWFVAVLCGDKLLSFFTSILFIAHPIHVEVVAHISGRADSLAVLFMLLCFIFYIKASNLNSMSVYTLMILSCIFALLSKEISLIFPVLLLLYHYSFKKELKIRQFSPILGITLIYILLRLTVFRRFLLYSSCPTNLFQRTPGFFVAITNYLRLMILPFDLHMEYGDRLFSFTNPLAMLGLVILFLFLVYAFEKRTNDRLVFFSIFWFFISLLPSSNLYFINAYMAEHWLYLSSIGFFLVLGKGLSFFYKTKQFKIPAVILTVSLLAFYSYLTARQNNYWREPITFYEKTLKYAPDNSGLYNGLGLAYRDIGKDKEAIAMFKEAIEVNPDDVNGYINLGLVYHELGKNEDAITSYKEAIQLDPSYAKGYNNLAVVYHDIGKKEEAVTLYNKAIETNPNYAMAYYNLGNAYQDIGKTGEAVASYKKAIKLNPDYAKTYYNLGLVYQNIGKTKEAVASYKRAIRLDPGYAKAYVNLAIAHQGLSKSKKAIGLYKKAIQLNPNFAEAHYNLGNTYRELSKNGEAITSYKKAIQLNPNFAEAHYNLGNAYREIGEDKEAITSYKKAIELNPNNAGVYNNLSMAYFHEKQYDLAIEYCDKAIGLGYKVHPEFLKALEPYRKK